ncbi:MAG: lamin tail domain-containing protein, partial [Candidatus Marinimicrobia bacterium]|nr:lamin tail domain-containing protein [Candidatus Neomarinimicrobiota bacterium]MCF7922205.1 lamin tail domain-containing protein [Candidatus Neomarinimicrobiota bacterium]
WHVWSAPDGANEFTTPGLATITIETPAEPSTIFITEIADPNNDASARFVELFNIGTSNVDLGSGWALQRWTNDAADPQTPVLLTGIIPASGFYLVAASGANFETVYGIAADQDVGTGGVGDSNGDDQIALLDPSGAIVDMFGVPGEDGSGTAHEFEDGRAERVSTVTVGNPVWDVAEWAIDNDSGGGLGPIDAPDGFDPNVWFTYIDPIMPPALVAAYSTSETEIVLDYNQDLASVDVADYSLTGTAGVTFTSATIDGTDASIVYLTAAADITGDGTLDVLADAANGTDIDFYAGITPIAYTNALNPGGTINLGITGTFAGLVTAVGNNNVWMNDGNDAYMGVLIFDYNFDATVTVGDEIMITAALDVYHNLSELKSPVLLGTSATGSPTIPAVISGSDIDSSLAADTNPAEQWEGQLVKIDGATVLSYDAAIYAYELSDDGGITSFLVGNNIYSATLDIGSQYDVVGIVNYGNDLYKLNPRDAADVIVIPPFPTHTVDFETGGVGADWNWTMEENGDNPPLEFIANPVSGGINTSATVAKFTARLTGQPWALCYTSDDGEFTFDATNSTVNIMVYKTVLSDVGLKVEGGTGTVTQLLVANTVTNAWEELTFDFSAVEGQTFGRLVLIPDFTARAQENIIYFDNIQVPDGIVPPPPAEPEIAAPTPTIAPENVISLFSNAYTDVTVDTWSTGWDMADVADVMVDGDDVKLYTNLTFAGIETATAMIDASGMTHFHLDIWTPDPTADPAIFKVKLVDWGADAAYGGGDDVEHELTFTAPTLMTESWVSLDMPLADFTGLTTRGHIAQLILTGDPNTVYLDNVFFYAEVVENDLNLTFEDDSDNANWGVYDGTSGYTTVAFDATAGVDGTGGLVLGDGGYGYYIKRPVVGTVGTDYFLSVDVKTVGWDNPDTYPITLAVEGLDVAENSISINSLTEFTNITLTGTITSADGYIKLQGSNTTAANAGGTISVTLDNLVFIDDYVPPPDLDIDLAFEDDTDAVNWGVYDGTSGYTTVAFDATAGVDGSGALVFGDGGYGYYIKRPVAATPGTDYSLSIDIKTVGWDVPETYPITLAVEGLDAVENSISVNSLTDFTTITLTGTATNATGYIKFQGSNTTAANAGGTISVTIDNLMFDDALGIADLVAPTLVSASALSSSTVELVFDEDIDPVTGAVAANYTLDHGIGAPTAAVVLEDVVTLTLGTGMMFDSTYTVIVNNVEDLSGNVIAVDTEASFMYAYTFVPDLFFSEYIEGSASNKALEIYNPTDVDIDLSGYLFTGANNVSVDWEYYWAFPVDTANVIAAHSVYVVVDTNASPELKALADFVINYPFSPTGFNGNDARGLIKVVGQDSILIDAIGFQNNPDQLNFDVAGVAEASLNHTLIRKASVGMGNPDWALSAGTDADNSEWVVLPIDTYMFLGSHPHTDLAGPELAGIVAVSETQLQLRFSEPIVSADAMVLTNYSVSDDIGNPTAVTMINDYTYLLTVAAFTQNMDYTLTVNGIHDLTGNMMATDAMIEFMLDVPGSLPIDRIMNDFVDGIGNWAHPTYSGSTSGILTTSTFASSDSLAFAGTHSGEMVLLDDPAVTGGWFVRLWNVNRVDRIDADSKMFFYLRGGNANMQVRIVIKDDDPGYDVGPWHDVTYAEDDWQVISIDLENDVLTGWAGVGGNGIINAASGTVAIDGIQIRCSEDISTTLFLDMVTERYNIDPVEVTFNVDMSVQTLMEKFAPASDFVDVAGNFNGWGENAIVLTDTGADSIYTTTLTGVYPGQALEYKFRINGSWSDDTAEFPYGGPARTYVVPDTNSVVFCWYNDVDTYVGVDGLLIPQEYALHNNYPNPFNPITNIKYDIPENTYVRLSIYNTLGQHVVDLVNEDQAPGFYHLQWNGLNKNGTPVSSGMFIYRLTTPEFTKSGKMTYLK